MLDEMVFLRYTCAFIWIYVERAKQITKLFYITYSCEISMCTCVFFSDNDSQIVQFSASDLIRATNNKGQKQSTIYDEFPFSILPMCKVIMLSKAHS